MWSLKLQSNLVLNGPGSRAHFSWRAGCVDVLFRVQTLFFRLRLSLGSARVCTALWVSRRRCCWRWTLEGWCKSIDFFQSRHIRVLSWVIVCILIAKNTWLRSCADLVSAGSSWVTTFALCKAFHGERRLSTTACRRFLAFQGTLRHPSGFFFEFCLSWVRSRVQAHVGSLSTHQRIHMDY